MTTLTAPTRRRPVPWTKLAWVTWRRNRSGITGAAVLLGGLAIVTVATGLQVHAVYARYLTDGCATHLTRGCAGVPFTQQPMDLYMGGVEVTLHVVPTLLGMFLGAPLLAREFEASTFRFAWTQGAGRARMTLSTLTLLALALTVAASLLGVLTGWAFRPEESVGLASRWQPGQFDVTGVTFAAWTLFSFTFGVFAGTLIRRTVPAMAAAALGSAALTVLSFWKLDPRVLTFRPAVARATAAVLNHYLFSGSYVFSGSGMQLNQPGPGGTWMVNGWVTGAAGHRLSAYQSFQRAGNVKPGEWAGWLAGTISRSGGPTSRPAGTGCSRAPRRPLWSCSP